MDILIFEYITGGGMIDETLPPSLVQEGDMMLSAVVRDFEVRSHHNVSVLRDYRLKTTKISNNDRVINSDDNYIEYLEVLVQHLDALLIIAPETDGILISLCERFSNHDCLLLNSDIQSIKLTSNKYETYKHLQYYDIAQIPTFLPNEIDALEANQFVMKPVDGVGCENLSLLSNRIELKAAVAQHQCGQFIVQPYINGTHASLSLICWNGECLLLSCNEQCIKVENEGFELVKCQVNIFDKHKFESFSQKLVHSLPSLQGYIGVDILITEEEILLVEINPRLTTSYAGLSSALGVNPAEMILHCFAHQQLPKFEATRNNKITIEIEADRAA